MRKSPNLFRQASAALNIQGTLPAAAPRLPTLRRVCHYCSAGLPTQRLIKLKFWDWLCIPMRTLDRVHLTALLVAPSRPGRALANGDAGEHRTV